MCITNLLPAFLRPLPLLRQRAPPLPFHSAPNSLCYANRVPPVSRPSHSLSARAASSGGQAAKHGSKRGAKRPRRRSNEVPKGALSNVGVARPMIQWYPGHIAKAERALKESLKAVDVVIEVRDCRIPIATSHPLVPQWIAGRTHVLALGRADLVPEAARADWRAHLRASGMNPRFVDAKRGRGVKELKKLAVQAGGAVNERRCARGLLPRPVRCLVIGYPNVGKSALINRLCGRRAAKSENKPGVTRNFQWIRISEDIDLLDMPGIIPAKLVDQDTALRLAICDDIGHGAYDAQTTAGLLIEELKRVMSELDGYFEVGKLKERFKVDPLLVSGEEFVYLAAERLHHGDLERTAVRLLTEFRAGDLGPVALEAPSML